jgi:hypothetical protein
MKSIINATTGKFHYCANEYSLTENEIAIDALPQIPYNSLFEALFWNFENNDFKVVVTDNEKYAEYQKSLIPKIITRRQFKIALAILGKNEADILNGINQLSEPTKTIALISYTEAGIFERDNPELIFVGKTFLQMTDDEIDNIFVVGSQY